MKLNMICIKLHKKPKTCTFEVLGFKNLCFSQPFSNPTISSTHSVHPSIQSIKKPTSVFLNLSSPPLNIGCIYYSCSSSQVNLTCSVTLYETSTNVHTLGGLAGSRRAFMKLWNHEMTSWPPSWTYDVMSEIHDSFNQCVFYLKNNPAKFIPMRFETTEPLKIVAPIRTRTTARTRWARDIEPVPDPKSTCAI